MSVLGDVFVLGCVFSCFVVCCGFRFFICEMGLGVEIRIQRVIKYIVYVGSGILVVRVGGLGVVGVGEGGNGVVLEWVGQFWVGLYTRGVGSGLVLGFGAFGNVQVLRVFRCQLGFEFQVRGSFGLLDRSWICVVVVGAQQVCLSQSFWQQLVLLAGRGGRGRVVNVVECFDEVSFVVGLGVGVRLFR